MSPASFKPLEPDDLIGSAGVAARALVAKAKRVRWGIGRRKSLHDQVSLDLWEGRQS